MTHTVTARRGHMNDKGEYVDDEVEVAFEHESGIVGAAAAKTESEAVRLARADAEARLAERARRAEERKLREAEDPMARLARLEAIVKEAGLDA